MYAMLSRKNKLILTSLVIFGMIFLLFGCFSSRKNSVESEGKLKVSINIPQDYVSAQYVSHTLQLSKVKVTLTKGSIVLTKEGNISGESVDIIFDNLESGAWSAKVAVIDTDGYDVYTGEQSGTVISGTLVTLDVTLTLSLGDLDVQVQIPEGLEVSTGSVTLKNMANPDENIESEMELTGNTGLASFTQIKSTTWPIEVFLFNSAGDPVTSGNGKIDVLPGRKSTAQVEFNSGQLLINVEWVLKPSAPTGLVVSVGDGNVALNWNANSEANIAGYAVYRSEELVGEKKLLTKNLIQEVTYTDSTVEIDHTYFYWVQAFDVDNYSSYLSDSCSVLVRLPFNPGSYKIVFDSYRDGNNEIYIMNADGSDLKNLSDWALNDCQPSWSPDGSKIVYTSIRDSRSQVCVINSDGTSWVQFTTDSTNKRNPKFSPDGTKIIFEKHYNYSTPTYSGYKWDLWTINVDGSELTGLQEYSSKNYTNAAWSPDGQTIAFEYDGSNTLTLYLMNADGTEKRRLTNRSAREREPKWSPDGTKIAFLSENNMYDQIYVINADGTGLLQLTGISAHNIEPAWSPDGDKIVFTSYRDGNGEIYVMDADGRNQVRLTNNEAFDVNAKWSPDGQKIAFISERDGNKEIYIMNPDGSDQINITNNSSVDYDFDWVSN